MGKKKAITQMSATQREWGNAVGRAREGRKDGRERIVSIKQRSNTKKEQSNIRESAGGMEQGHEDMCSFDDKEIRHERVSV